MRKRLLFILICFFMFNLCVNSHEIEHFIAPSGIEKKVILSQNVSLKTAVVGQKVEAIFLDDFIYDNKIIAPKDSVVMGSIVSYYIAQNPSQESSLQIKFTTIRTPYNNIIPISAVIKTDSMDGIIKSKKGSKEMTFNPASELNILFTQPITLCAQ